MIESLTTAPGFLGTLPGWITAIATSGGALGFLTLAVRWRLGERKLSIDAETVELSGDEGIRKHWAEEVARITKRIDEQGTRYREREERAEQRYLDALERADKRQVKLLAEAEVRHQKCTDEVEQLREKVERLSEEIAGYRANLAQHAASEVVLLDSTTGAPASHKAAIRRLEEFPAVPLPSRKEGA